MGKLSSKYASKTIATVLFLLLSMAVQKSFAQTMSENEKHLSVILDTLDNAYYWKSIPEDMYSRSPPEGYWKKYPFRVQLYQLLKDAENLLDKPMSGSYLLTLFDKKHERKISSSYNKIADKIIAHNIVGDNIRLWKIATLNDSDRQEYINRHFLKYVTDEFVRKELLTNETKEYIIKAKNFDAGYFGYFGKAVDLQIIDQQLNYLQTEMRELYMGDASRWAGYLFLENGISPKRSRAVSYKNWYVEKYYYNKVEANPKLSYSDFDWDNYNDEANVMLVIRFLNSLKENYDEVSQKYKAEE